MKKLVLGAFTVGLLAIGCGNAEAEKAAQENAKAEKEMKSLDSATAVIEGVNAEIEASSEEVDNLLNDL